jgi:hypothetical protein
MIELRDSTYLSFLKMIFEKLFLVWIKVLYLVKENNICERRLNGVKKKSNIVLEVKFRGTNYSS